MKRIQKIILLLSLMISYNLNAQKKVEYGFYLGTSITSLSGFDDFTNTLSEEISQVLGLDFPMSHSNRSFLFNGGGFVSYNVNSWFVLRGGLEYAPKGEKLEGEGIYPRNYLSDPQYAIQQKTKIKVAYIEFPISVQLTTRQSNKPDRFYLYGNFGLSPAIKVFSKMEIETQSVKRTWGGPDGITEEVLEEENNTEKLDGISDFDFGIFLSAGVNIQNAFIDLKYNKGTININKNSDGFSFKNSLFSMTFGFMF
jgi:hypothetical protein